LETIRVLEIHFENIVGVFQTFTWDIKNIPWICTLLHNPLRKSPTNLKFSKMLGDPLCGVASHKKQSCQGSLCNLVTFVSSEVDDEDGFTLQDIEETIWSWEGKTCITLIVQIYRRLLAA
jgi:hypothetical protein